MGFTHVELMPVAEHPFGGSWGYQVGNYYAPTARFGHPDDLRFLIDHLHEQGFGVLVDWVPAHFPRDAYALGRFDGTAVYEHADPRQGAHPDWGTLVFNYGRNEVRNFLVANALFWIDEYHVDGLRVDAVASMLYLDYSRKAGEWVPNRWGGRENEEAIAFLRELNATIAAQAPGRGGDRRGVDRVAEGHRAGGPRRARLRVQVEHGVDARHPLVLPEGPDLPRAPPQPAHLRAALRVQRALRAAALARRGGAREGLALREDARRPLAEAREPARAVRVDVGHPGKKLLFMGGELAPARQSGTTIAASTGTCSTTPATRASSGWSRI